MTSELTDRDRLEQLLAGITEGRPLGADEIDVLEHILRNELITDQPDEFEAKARTFGQRLSDKVSEFGGSWLFIISFFTFILVWVTVNVALLVMQPFDPYPFILLNLLLSCIAAIQAPIIMMSQNRREETDRLRARADYRVNLKAEVEIRLLHDKIDALESMLQSHFQQPPTAR